MAYRINEIFYSLQGEGFWTGTPAVFVRFSGCNLRCPFCDTAHQAFTPMSADDIIVACVEARRVVHSVGLSTPGQGQGEGPVECKLSASPMTPQAMGGAEANEESVAPRMALPSDASEQAVTMSSADMGVKVWWAVSQKGQRRLQPEKRTKTAGVPVQKPSPWRE